MPRLICALAAAILPAIPLATPLAVAAAPAGGEVRATLSSVTPWESDTPGHGGYSGIEVTADGRRFFALSDHGTLASGALDREGARLTGVGRTGLWPMADTAGAPVSMRLRDAEGLALASDGSLYVSFERDPRIWRYARPGARPTALPRHPDFAGFNANGALEALAITPDGTLLTMPEDPVAGRFPVYRFADKRWSQPFAIPARGAFKAVEADIGPDGRLYLLERRLAGPFGFATRVRRFTLGETALSGEQTLVETRPGTHGNLEGLSVWRDPDGRTRLTMIADNNFLAIQRSQIVEYVLP
ncbi:esterase-like activity of phytase family protein [Mesobaculum littorinae]|uniref:Esterase-like activity of phytase family protein n=1 Tax=Mesobaculum littorinae TaxID=2486419 RepID=A0A438AHJ8_9RHOB|nr:esterase-like activity of phytase family protein [Mesobaculum littorinae]RVV98144.1 esterase-like activity of phytase family protein [Mesobaculum littorinae]